MNTETYAAGAVWYAVVDASGNISAGTFLNPDGSEGSFAALVFQSKARADDAAADLVSAGEHAVVKPVNLVAESTERPVGWLP